MLTAARCGSFSRHRFRQATRRTIGDAVSSFIDFGPELWSLINHNAIYTALASSLGVFSYWTYVGGPIFTFTYLKPLLFGRNFHTLEYPHGSLRTITVRIVNEWRIRNQIAKLHGIPVDGVKHMNVWIEHYFSEPINTRAVQHYLSTSSSDGSWIFWTRDVENVIPTKGLTLGSLGTDEMKLARMRAERVQRYLLRFETSALQNLRMSEIQMSRLQGLCAQQDPVLMALHAMHSDESASAFRCLALLRSEQLGGVAVDSSPLDASSRQESEQLAAMVRFIGGLAQEHRKREREKSSHSGTGLGPADMDGDYLPRWFGNKSERADTSEATAADSSRGVSLPYEEGVQLIAHALAGSPTPLTLFQRFHITPSMFVKNAEHFLKKKGDFLESSPGGMFQLPLLSKGAVVAGSGGSGP